MKATLIYWEFQNVDIFNMVTGGEFHDFRVDFVLTDSSCHYLSFKFTNEMLCDKTGIYIAKREVFETVKRYINKWNYNHDRSQTN